MEAFTCTWLIPASLYSTGSSNVIKFNSGVRMVVNTAFNVVDLPEPVGPVKKINPCGKLAASINKRFCSGSKPSLSTFISPVPLSKIRSTSFSPNTAGQTDTRTSILRFWNWIPKLPSCGKRFSAISSLDKILIREIIAAIASLDGGVRSYKEPSIRKRKLTRSSNISK